MASLGVSLKPRKPAEEETKQEFVGTVPIRMSMSARFCA
jgi:hypothetical protein